MIDVVSAAVIVATLATSAHAVPTANDASFQVVAGATLNSDLSPLVSDFTNPDFAILSAPSHGIVVLQTLTGLFSYTPVLGYIGPDAFGYRAFEAASPALLDTGVISITVCPPGGCPSTSVPEPATSLLLVAGAAVATAWRLTIARRRSQPTP